MAWTSRPSPWLIGIKATPQNPPPPTTRRVLPSHYGRCGPHPPNQKYSLNHRATRFAPSDIAGKIVMPFLLRPVPIVHGPRVLAIELNRFALPRWQKAVLNHPLIDYSISAPPGVRPWWRFKFAWPARSRLSCLRPAGPGLLHFRALHPEPPAHRIHRGVVTLGSATSHPGLIMLLHEAQRASVFFRLPVA